jgi:hypothetical protein
MKRVPDHFTVDGYEVRFLQSAPVTVCVIRSFTDPIQRIDGMAVCHPTDKWDEAIGRHKAMKDALTTKIFKQTKHGKTYCLECGDRENVVRAYWEHYKEVEG